MRSPLLVTLGVLTACVAGCGNLSNEDLLFVAALPDQALRMDPPAESDGSTTQGLSEYKTATDLALVTAAKLNVFTDDVLDHILDITSKRPTSRAEGKRVWGPFKVRKTGLTARLTMERTTAVECEVSASPLDVESPAYQWSIELNRATTGAYVGVISGTSRGYDFTHSCGALLVDVKSGKALGLRIDDPQLRGVDSIQVSWQRIDGDATISARVATSTSPDDALVGGLTYIFQRNSTGGGVFSFVILDDVRGQSNERFQAVLQWKQRGRPWRADFCVTAPGSTSTDCGASCGPSPRRRTYLDVPGPNGGTFGSEAECGGIPSRDPRTSMN